MPENVGRADLRVASEDVAHQCTQHFNLFVRVLRKGKDTRIVRARLTISMPMERLLRLSHPAHWLAPACHADSGFIHQAKRAQFCHTRQRGNQADPGRANNSER